MGSPGAYAFLRVDLGYASGQPMLCDQKVGLVLLCKARFLIMAAWWTMRLAAACGCRSIDYSGDASKGTQQAIEAERSGQGCWSDPINC